MTSTLFLDDYSIVIPSRAHSYTAVNGLEYTVSPNNYAVAGPSSVYSTTSDLAKWLCHIDSQNKETKAIFDMMFSPGILSDGEEISYGFGVLLSEFRGTKWVSHEGYWFFIYQLTSPFS